MTDDRTERLEEKLSHLQKVADELSDVVAEQAKQIDALTRRVQMLMEREAGREADAGSGLPLADQKPPHW